MASEITPLLQRSNNHEDVGCKRRTATGNSLQSLESWMKMIVILSVSSTIVEIVVRIGYMKINSQLEEFQGVNVLDIILIIQSLLIIATGIVLHIHSPKQNSFDQDDISERGEMKMHVVLRKSMSKYKLNMWTKVLIFSLACASFLQVFVIQGSTENGSSIFGLVLCFVILQGLCFLLAGVISNSMNMLNGIGCTRETSHQISCFAWVCLLFDLGCTFSYISCSTRLIYWFERANQSIDHTKLVLCSTVIMFVYLQLGKNYLR